MIVFQVISSFDLGGAERVAINITKSPNPNFKFHLFEVVKGHSDFSTSLKKEFKENGIPYHCSPFKNRKIAICLFWIWFIWYYIKYSPNIIHAHTETPDLSLWIFRKIAWLCFWISPSYIRTIHNTKLWNEWEKIGNIVEKYYIKHQSNIAISTSTRDCYTRCYGGEQPPIIYNGIDEIPQKKFQVIKPTQINILFAGRFEYQKGVDQMIAVVSALKYDSRFYFHVVGSGSMEPKVITAFKGLTNVTVYQKVFGLAQYIGSFDYLFMPSNHEGLALMPIEASLAYTPTIINNCPGLKDTLPEDWPLSVNNNSIPDFIELISKKLNKQNYGELAKNAHRFAIERFSLNMMQKKYEELYRNRQKK